MRNNLYVKRVLFYCTLFLSFIHVYADIPNYPYEGAKPRVGLVLSGGGAKGIAHIGVIKALEDHDIPIDCVAGTSAGAIVGSLYACGWSPEEILALFTSPAFKYWSSGTVSRDNINYATESMLLPEWVDFGLNIGDNQSEDNIFSQIIPTHLISPIPMNLEFLELYSPYSKQCEGDFNNLFVPLRTVCSDVYHKHKIVCSGGSVSDAVRASMSFPLVFKPIEMNGVLVYDGGIYDNFPVDVMHEDFNPEFIIGSSVSAPDGKPIAGNLYSQLEDMIIQNNDYSLPDDLGVKIQVPVLGFGVFDWEAADEIFEIGYKTGLSMIDSIQSRCKYREPLDSVNARRKIFREHTPDIEFAHVEVSGASVSQNRYIKNIFQRDEAPVTMEQVKASYYRLVSDGKFTDLFPQAVFPKNGEPILSLRASVKQPWNVGVGGWISSSVQSQLFLTFGYHTLSLNSLNVDLSGWIGQTYYAAMLSGRIILPGSEVSALNLIGVISRQKYYENELLFYQNGTLGYFNEAQQFVRLEYSLALGKPAKLFTRIGYGHIMDYYYGQMNPPSLHQQQEDYQTVALEIGYKANTLNNQLYPISGRLLDVNVVGLHENFKSKIFNENDNRSGKHFSLSGKAEWKHFFTLHPKFVLGLTGEGLFTFTKLYQDYVATLMHSVAFAPTPSTRNYFNISFRSDNYLAAGAVPVWLPFQKFQIRGDFYLYAPLRNLVDCGNEICRYDGWFKTVDFIGEIAAVYNFKFASLSLYCNYLSHPAKNWNFGINFGLFFQAPRLAR